MSRLVLSTLAGSVNVSDAASSKWMVVLASLVTAMLVVLLADRLAVLTWMLVPLPDSERPEVVVAPASGGGAPLQLRNAYTGLGDLHLLGEAAKELSKKQVVREVPADVPETRLQLSLKGIYHSDDANEAVAIIAGPGGQEEIYHVGDSLPGDVMLEEIGERRVVLSRGGRLEALTFPQESSVGAASSVPATSPRASQPARRINAKPLIGRYISEAADNPEALLDIAQVEPVIEDGAFRGFRLRPGRKRSLLRRLGLRSGDVVTSVNGTVLDNLPRAMELMQGLADATVIDATVLRNGEEIPYTFALN